MRKDHLAFGISIALCGIYLNICRYENIYRKGLYPPACIVGNLVGIGRNIVAGIGNIPEGLVAKGEPFLLRTV